MNPRTFLTVQELLWYNYSAVCESSAQGLYGGANGDLLQEGLCHRLLVPGLLQPEAMSLWQATADPCLCRRHSNTQRQVWLSLLWRSMLLSLGPGVHKGFVCIPQVSLVGMRFDSKYDFAPSTVLFGLLLYPWMWNSFYRWDPTFSCQ